MLLYLVPLLCLLIVVFSNLYHGIPFRNLMDEPVLVGDVPYYTGFISNVGVLFWGAAAAVCLFCWALFRRFATERSFANFLLYFGLLSVLLLLDDLLLLHEHIFYNRLGIPEGVTYVIYATLLLTGLLAFRNEILETPFLLLLIAFGFLALSVFIDGIEPFVESYVGEWRIFYEDGLKLLGIAGWFGYFSRACFSRLVSLL
ncbi:MAG: hypothetical protein LPK07_08415 [Hymenobacteraceae bacterium]|nr:hypothetical protein [Hymenobacteraceae bacterium]